MKKSKLKKIIKEEVNKTLLESQTKNFLDDWKEKSKEFTKNIKNLQFAYKKEHGKFFKTNIIQLKYLNQFFEESKNRGDI